MVVLNQSQSGEESKSKSIAKYDIQHLIFIFENEIYKKSLL